MPTFDIERRLKRQGFPLVAGVDEAGRGPLAGPVLAAAVILPLRSPFPEWLGLVDDSKALTPRQRERALEHIELGALGIGVGLATPHEIDATGIAEATRVAMRRAIEGLAVRPSYLLIDFVHHMECDLPYRALIHGDSLCYSIAAASIVAKVTRDRMMEGAERSYPGYGFARHKGYATADHLRMLAALGPSPIHRFSFSPLRNGS